MRIVRGENGDVEGVVLQRGGGRRGLLVSGEERKAEREKGGDIHCALSRLDRLWRVLRSPWPAAALDCVPVVWCLLKVVSKMGTSAQLPSEDLGGHSFP